MFIRLGQEWGGNVTHVSLLCPYALLGAGVPWPPLRLGAPWDHSTALGGESRKGMGVGPRLSFSEVGGWWWGTVPRRDANCNSLRISARGGTQRLKHWCSGQSPGSLALRVMLDIKNNVTQIHSFIQKMHLAFYNVPWTLLCTKVVVQPNYVR